MFMKLKMVICIAITCVNQKNIKEAIFLELSK